MEYYNRANSAYIAALKSPSHRYTLRVELLTYGETAIGEITKDVLVDVSGQININYQQIVRRSCTLNLMNVDSKYTPSINSAFWFQRKFKLWLGLKTREDIFWFSQGVFLTKSASGDNKIMTIEGIDKGGLLNGDLKTNMADVQYIIEVGSNIGQLVKDTLMMNMTSAMNYNQQACEVNVLDPVLPLVDMKYFHEYTQNEISVDSGAYLGDLFEALSEGYGADVYYDRNGRFNFTSMIDSDNPNGYIYVPHSWEFAEGDAWLNEASYSYGFDGINVVTVYTNSSDPTLENVSYTAYNNNPLSPLRVRFAGIRRLEPIEISYVSVSRDEMISRCKQYAEYILLKQSILNMAVELKCPIMPHIDVNQTVGITNKTYGLDNNTFVIQSITIPLSCEQMDMNVTNINWLPIDTNITGVANGYN